MSSKGTARSNTTDWPSSFDQTWVTSGLGKYMPVILATSSGANWL